MASAGVRAIRVKPSAEKVLLRMPADRARAVTAAVRRFSLDPWARHPNAKPMRGWSGFVRLRVGDWRAIVKIEHDAIEVWDVGPRGQIYKDWEVAK